MNQAGGNAALDAHAMGTTLTRIAHEIVERADDLSSLGLVGIRRRGAPLAERIADAIETIEDIRVGVGALDITLYRDDLTAIGPQPKLHATEIAFDVTRRHIVLVDDVLYTGRTVRAALDALIDLGRPRLIQLAVLIDRGHRELPIRADYVGKNIPTSYQQDVQVCVSEIDGRDEVAVVQMKDAGGRTR